MQHAAGGRQVAQVFQLTRIMVSINRSNPWIARLLQKGKYFPNYKYHPIQSNTIQYHPIPSNTIQYHPIPSNTIRYHPTQSNTSQYQYHNRLTPMEGNSGRRAPKLSDQTNHRKIDMPSIGHALLPLINRWMPLINRLMPFIYRLMRLIKRLMPSINR